MTDFFVRPISEETFKGVRYSRKRAMSIQEPNDPETCLCSTQQGSYFPLTFMSYLQNCISIQHQVTITHLSTRIFFLKERTRAIEPDSVYRARVAPCNHDSRGPRGAPSFFVWLRTKDVFVCKVNIRLSASYQDIRFHFSLCIYVILLGSHRDFLLDRRRV